MATTWEARHRLQSRHEYQTAFDTFFNQGFRLIDVCGYGVNGADQYAAIWEVSPGPPWAGTHFLTRQEHQDQFVALRDQGFRPVTVSGYDAAGVARYAALWEQRPGPLFDARHHRTAEQMQADFNELEPQGFRPVDVCGFVVNGEVLFTSIWEQSPIAQWEIRHNLTAGAFLTIHNHNLNHGFIARRISGYEIGGQRHYAAIWEKDHGLPPTWTSDHDVSLADYQAKFDAMRTRGFTPLKVNGIPRNGADPHYSTIWHKPHLSHADETFIDTTVRTFMVNHGIPGASVALTHHERLVFAKGYGVADPATNQPVTTSHLFRIASIAKPITAVAIFRLIEAGQLQLGQRVFGANGILGTTFGTQPYGPNIDQITVQHLLEHTSGWPRATDPMFGHPTLDEEEIITWMLDNEPLVTIPGATNDYLNFGYCVLGRIIERVSGLTYAEYVRQQVLAPCGISDMHIAGDTLAERRGNEVVYVGQAGSNPYGMRVARMDAHGGWLASATDLLRFLVRVDGLASKPDMLSAASIATMITPTTAPMAGGGATGYAKGWNTNPAGNRWHDGDLPGTSSIMVRNQNNYGWAVLCNSRNDAQLNLMRTALDNVMWDVVRRITDWPGFDLF